VDLPEGLRCALKPIELAHLLKAFVVGFDALRAMDVVAKRVPLAREALADLNAAVHYLTDTAPHHGQARWSALQALEKALKGFIAQSHASFPRSHSLADLHTRAVVAGLSALEADEVANVQCDAGIRYGEIRATLTEAHSAYWSSLLACGQIAHQLQKRLPRRWRRRATARTSLTRAAG
jgi:hypothetical protein